MTEEAQPPDGREAGTPAGPGTTSTDPPPNPAADGPAGSGPGPIAAEPGGAPGGPGGAPEPERLPVWGYSDLFLVAGAAIPSMLAGWGVVRLLFTLFRFHPRLPVVELLPEQLLGYLLLFGAVALLLRIEYDRPFWRSVGWTPFRAPAGWIIVAGLFSAIAIAILGSLIETPVKANPMTEMMEDQTSMILMAIFGTTIAPIAEELLFRGFLQPLLVRSLGALAGILLSSVPFGFLHYHEYGNSWRHALLIGLAGSAFGWMRHATGSTRASALMHAAYNWLIFFVVFTQGKHLLHR